jgi:hypothetical protein
MAPVLAVWASDMLAGKIAKATRKHNFKRRRIDG